MTLHIGQRVVIQYGGNPRAAGIAEITLIKEGHASGVILHSFCGWVVGSQQHWDFENIHEHHPLLDAVIEEDPI